MGRRVDSKLVYLKQRDCTAFRIRLVRQLWSVWANSPACFAGLFALDKSSEADHTLYDFDIVRQLCLGGIFDQQGAVCAEIEVHISVDFRGEGQGACGVCQVAEVVELDRVVVVFKVLDDVIVFGACSVIVLMSSCIFLAGVLLLKK